MNVILIFLLSFLIVENQCLAPHPIYYTIDGSPRTIKVGNNGRAYYVHWDGKNLTISDKPPKPPTDLGKDWLGGWGCWASLGISAIFWSAIIYLVVKIWQ